MRSTLATVTVEPRCLCGDLKDRHRKVMRWGEATWGACKECGCDGFESAEGESLAPQDLDVVVAAIVDQDVVAGFPGGVAHAAPAAAESNAPLTAADVQRAADLIEQPVVAERPSDADPGECVGGFLPAQPGDVDLPHEPAAPAPAVPQSTVELLQAAAASPHQKTRSLGAKVAALLADLNALITVERRRAEAAAARAAERAEANAKRAAERAEAERRIAELQDELAKAREAFRAAGGIPGPERARPAAGVPSKTIRAWAAEAGIECSTTGRVGQPVVDAYYAAHPDAPRP